MVGTKLRRDGRGPATGASRAATLRVRVLGLTAGREYHGASRPTTGRARARPAGSRPSEDAGLGAEQGPRRRRLEHVADARWSPPSDDGGAKIGREVEWYSKPPETQVVARERRRRGPDGDDGRGRAGPQRPLHAVHRRRATDPIPPTRPPRAPARGEALERLVVGRGARHAAPVHAGLRGYKGYIGHGGCAIKLSEGNGDALAAAREDEGRSVIMLAGEVPRRRFKSGNTKIELRVHSETDPDVDGAECESTATAPPACSTSGLGHLEDTGGAQLYRWDHGYEWTIEFVAGRGRRRAGVGPLRARRARAARAAGQAPLRAPSAWASRATPRRRSREARDAEVEGAAGSTIRTWTSSARSTTTATTTTGTRAATCRPSTRWTTCRRLTRQRRATFEQGTTPADYGSEVVAGAAIAHHRRPGLGHGHRVRVAAIPTVASAYRRASTAGRRVGRYGESIAEAGMLGQEAHRHGAIAPVEAPVRGPRSLRPRADGAARRLGAAGGDGGQAASVPRGGVGGPQHQDVGHGGVAATPGAETGATTSRSRPCPRRCPSCAWRPQRRARSRSRGEPGRPSARCGRRGRPGRRRWTSPGVGLQVEGAPSATPGCSGRTARGVAEYAVEWKRDDFSPAERVMARAPANASRRGSHAFNAEGASPAAATEPATTLDGVPGTPPSERGRRRRRSTTRPGPCRPGRRRDDRGRVEFGPTRPSARPRWRRSCPVPARRAGRDAPRSSPRGSVWVQNEVQTVRTNIDGIDEIDHHDVRRRGDAGVQTVTATASTSARSKRSVAARDPGPVQSSVDSRVRPRKQRITYAVKRVDEVQTLGSTSRNETRAESCQRPWPRSRRSSPTCRRCKRSASSSTSRTAAAPERQLRRAASRTPAGRCPAADPANDCVAKNLIYSIPAHRGRTRWRNT